MDGWMRRLDFASPQSEDSDYDSVGRNTPKDPNPQKRGMTVYCQTPPNLGRLGGNRVLIHKY